MNMQENISLKEYTTFKIGGNAKYFCEVVSEEELIEAVEFAQNKNVPIFILGGGSNILVSDAGFSGLVIKMNLQGISYEPEGNKVVVKAFAGVSWDGLVKDTVDHNLYGLENLSGIPGTVGASPVQNIGAYGSEVKDTIVTVRVFDYKDKKFRDLLNIECGFGYRNSIFKKPKWKHLIIVSVSFLLSKGKSINIDYKDIKNYFDINGITEPSLFDVRQAVIEIRNGKFPDLRKIGTAGSFFKNPIITKDEHKILIQQYPLIPSFPTDDNKMKISLAWVLDKVCDLKGYTKGNVALFENQPLVLVNLSSASSREIKSFANEIKDIVFERTKVTIETEVEYVPN